MPANAMIYIPISPATIFKVSARGLGEFEINDHISPSTFPIFANVVIVTIIYSVNPIIIAIKNALGILIFAFFMSSIFTVIDSNVELHSYKQKMPIRIGLTTITVDKF